MALIVGAVIGFVVACLIQYSGTLFGPAPVGAVLLNMAVFGAVISYAMQMLSFILLRKNLPNIARPYVSPMGVPGAWAALLIALFTLVSLFLNTDYRLGVVGCAIWYGLAVIYFGVYARRYMVRSPEEEFALGSCVRRRSGVAAGAEQRVTHGGPATHSSIAGRGKRGRRGAHRRACRDRSFQAGETAIEVADHCRSPEASTLLSSQLTPWLLAPPGRETGLGRFDLRKGFVEGGTRPLHGPERDLRESFQFRDLVRRQPGLLRRVRRLIGIRLGIAGTHAVIIDATIRMRNGWPGRAQGLPQQKPLIPAAAMAERRFHEPRRDKAPWPAISISRR